MGSYGTPSYRVGLIIADAQPFHNGHVKAIGDALMYCDEVIISFYGYDTAYFDYNINQKLSRNIFGTSPRIAHFGVETPEREIIIPKLKIEYTLDKLDEANYNMPTHFFTNYDDWVEPAKELQLETIRISTLANTKSNEIYQSILNGTDLWKEKVPYANIDMIETYIATKNRNF